MAAHSYFNAALTKYDGLTAALFPGAVLSPVAFGKAAQVRSGSQVRTPSVVFVDTGSSPEHQSDSGGPETGGFTIDVFADTMADVDKIVAAIKWNGSPPNLKAGFDHGTLTLDAPLYHVSLTRTREVRSHEGDGQTAQRVHHCELTYGVEFATDPTLTPA